MEIPSYWDPMSEWTMRIPRNVDGTGEVLMWMRAGNAKHFGLDKFPSPECNRGQDPEGRCFTTLTRGKLAGANQGSFRLAYAWRDGPGKPHMARFRLSSGWKVETMQVITNHLRATYDGWFEIRNVHGNVAWNRVFSSDLSYSPKTGGGR